MNWNIPKFTQIAASVLTTPQARTPVQLLGKTTFTDNGRQITAIQQNPNKDSPWAKLAREGHQVVQFRGEKGGPYIAVAVDGKVNLYSEIQRSSQAPPPADKP